MCSGIVCGGGQEGGGGGGGIFVWEHCPSASQLAKGLNTVTVLSVVLFLEAVIWCSISSIHTVVLISVS